MLDPGYDFHVAKTKTKRATRPPHLRLVRTPHPLLAKWDPNLIRRIYPTLSWIVDHYFRAEFEGVEHMRDDACLVVGTHNGGMLTPDAYCLMVAFWRRFGLEAPGYGLMHRQAFRVPILGRLLTKLGAVHASRKNAEVVLEAGYPAFCCPGGDMDALKPYRLRHRVIFGNRMGFVSVAIRHQVPIIPVISVGAHETLFFLNDGRWLAEVSGAARIFRIKSIPFALSFPLGLTPAGLLSIPLPSKITVRVLPKIELAEPPRMADDPETVQRCFDHVRTTMQRSLNDLAARRRYPVLG
jgi:1-acyl-sn-glycerol-3-phosphate acyltransferase